MDFCSEINDMLMKTYRTVQEVEETKVKRNAHLNLTISELHLMEYIGRYGEGGATISALAGDLNYALPSVTVAVNKLEKKKYVVKQKSRADKRMVYVMLTPKGAKVNNVHQYIHKKMSREVAKEFNEQEREILLRGLQKLNDIFARSLTGYLKKKDE